ncbi:MAG TPA: SusC/RagA family TonB-linked outer membrane protein [Gemmatimonadales bacterium]|nr:SusC/RagA family TonB-linked outer membrane protein [Gemmatimonadales bacterium]
MNLIRRPHWCGVTLATVLLLGAGAPEARGQGAVVSGRVTDDHGVPLAAATVQLVELSVGVYTGNDGRYSIAVPAVRVSGQSVTLRVRIFGHKPAARQLTLTPGEHPVDFALATDVNLLEAVVVTGVQEATEQIKTPFSVTRVDASKMPVAADDPLRQLQGKIAANIVSNSGRPGSQPAVLLRGPTSINASGRGQDPLYIVDGVIINGALPDLNSQDIESIEVVKGAAGASLYGARAGNGVINITTKTGRGRPDGVAFTVRSEEGASDIERDFGLAHFQPLVMDETGTRFCQFVTGQPLCATTFNYAAEQARINNQPGDFAGSPKGFPIDPGATLSGTAPGYSGDPRRERFQINPWPGTNYNAVAQTVDPHVYASNSIDMRGGFGSTHFYASASNLTEPGAIRFLQGFVRNSFRANVDQSIGSAWNISLRTTYSRSTQDGLNQEGGGQAFFRLTRVPAVVNVEQVDTLGRLYIRPNLQGGGSQNENPLYSLQNVQRSDVTNRFIGGLTAQYNPVHWFTLEGDVGYDRRNVDFTQFVDKGYRTTTSNPTTNNGSIFKGSTGQEAVDASLNATFRYDFRPDLKWHGSLRYLYEQRDSSIEVGQGNFLAVKSVTSLGNATANQAVGSAVTSVRGIGVFAGAGLDFKDRYEFDGLVRRDGSSLYGAGNRWQTFGRASGAWLVMREPWWPLDQVTELKLRASYGTAGGLPPFIAQYETFTISNGVIALAVLGNRNLRPEVHHELELGADVELFGRYGLSATYARSRIENQILPVTVSSSTGYASQYQNIGTLLNITHELSLNLPLVQKPDVSWSMSVIYDHNRSWIQKLGVPPFFQGTILQGTGSMFQIKEGERYGTIYGHQFLTSCSQLPAPFNTDCGPGMSFQTNDEGWLVWVGAGNNPGMGITNNLWETSLPASQGPWGVAMNWGMPILLRGDPNNSKAAQVVALGNALPDFRFSVTQNVQWRRLSVYALVDASIGQMVWNQGLHWAHLDFLSNDVDQVGKSVQTAKPIGYYYRAPAVDGFSGLGGLYDQLMPNNYSVEDASYAKLRELSVSYHLGKLGGVGDWGISVVGRNLFTITGYRGFDPEIGIGAFAPQPGGATTLGSSGGQSASGAINAVDAFSFPNTRSFTIGLTTSF